MSDGMPRGGFDAQAPSSFGGATGEPQTANAMDGMPPSTEETQVSCPALPADLSQRRFNGLWLLLALAAFLAGFALVTRSELLLGLSFFTSGLGGGLLLWRAYSHAGQHLHLARLSASAILVATGWGALNAQLVAAMDGSSFEDVLAYTSKVFSYPVEFGYVCTAQLGALLCAASWLIAARVADVIGRGDSCLGGMPVAGYVLYMQQNPRASLGAWFLVAVVVAGQWAAMLTGRLGYMGLTMGEQTGISPWGVLFLNATGGAVLILGILTSDVRALGMGFRSPALARVALAVLIVGLYVPTALCGRRAFLYAGLIFLLGLRLGGARTLAGTGSSILRMYRFWVCLITLFLLVAVTWNYFLKFRYMGVQHGSSDSLQSLKALRAQDVLSRDPTFSTMQRKNLATRTFVLNYLAIVQRGLKGRAPLYGEGAYTSALSSIPAALYPDKRDLLLEEDLYAARFGISNDDNANSLCVSAFVDFGWIGLIMYPVIAVLLLVLMFGFFRRFQCSLGFAVTYGLALQQALSGGETTLVDLFLTFRNGALLFLLVFLLYSAFGAVVRYRNGPTGNRLVQTSGTESPYQDIVA